MLPLTKTLTMSQLTPEINLIPGRGRISTFNAVEPVLSLARALGDSPLPNTIALPTSAPGEVWRANGKIERWQRGEAEIEFRPGRGSVPKTEVLPPTPARVPMRYVRVPKGVGAVLTIDWATFCAEQIATKLAPSIDAYGAYQVRATLKQDLDLAGETAALTQFLAKPAAARLKAAAMTKTTTRTATKTTRIRAFSRS